VQRSLRWFLVCGLLAGSSQSSATGIWIGDPSPYASGVPGALYANRVRNFEPEEPGDTFPGLDGSAALFEPDDIGFGPEPDSNLSVALGTGGRIELTFERGIVTDGFAASSGSLDGTEILIFEDGLLDGASFYGRLRQSGRLVPLGSLAELASLDPTLPGLGPGGGDTAIGIDLDAIFAVPVDLIAILIVDDGLTGASQTFEVDAVANLSPGAIVPEPSTAVLLGFGIAALAAHARNRGGGRQSRPPTRAG